MITRLLLQSLSACINFTGFIDMKHEQSKIFGFFKVMSCSEIFQLNLKRLLQNM